jgi:hypothetical protein
VGHRLDVVAVRIVHVGRVEILVVVGAQAGRAVVLPARRHRRVVERVYSSAIGSGERDVRRAALRARAEPEVGHPLTCAEAGATLELHPERIAERRERLRIEALCLLEVADVRGYVVKHRSSFHGPDRA